MQQNPWVLYTQKQMPLLKHNLTTLLIFEHCIVWIRAGLYWIFYITLYCENIAILIFNIVFCTLFLIDPLCQIVGTSCFKVWPLYNTVLHCIMHISGLQLYSSLSTLVLIIAGINMASGKNVLKNKQHYKNQNTKNLPQCW